MIPSVRLYRTTGPDRLALVSVDPGTTPGTWLVRVARGLKAGKLGAGSAYGPFAEKELEARFNEVVANLKGEGFQTSGGQLLIAQLSEKGSKKRASAAQRLGWMRSKEAVDPLIHALSSAGDDACSIIDALGEIGDSKAIPAIRPWAERKLLSRRRSAVEAMKKLADAPGLAANRTRALERLPDTVRAVVIALDKQGDTSPTALVKAVLAVPLKERGLALDSLYELDDRLCVAAVRDVLEQSQFNAPHVWRYTKSILKRAILRHDFRTFGWLQHLIEIRGQTTKGTEATVKSGYDGKDHKVLIFGKRTQAFLKRAAWRYLRKLGRWRPESYAPAAAEAIINYHPSNARPARGFYGAWASAYLLHRVLWGSSARFVYTSRSVKFRFKSAKAVEAPLPSVREEPFAELWDARPLAYLRLLVGAKLPDIHRFALGGLQRHPWLIEKASNEEVRRMLEAPHAGTVEVGLAELGKRFDPNKPDWDLLGRLLEDERPIAQELGLRWLKLTAHLWTRDLEQTLAFLDSKAGEVRVLAASMVVSALAGSTPALRQALADKILARLKAPEATAGDHDRYARVATEALSSELLSRLSLDELMQMIASGSASVKAIAGGLLARRPGTFEALSLERVLPLVDSDVAAVRAAGIALMHSAVQYFREKPAVLFELAESRWSDVRTGAIGLLKASDVGRLGMDAIVGLCDSNHEEVQNLGKELVIAHLPQLDPQELLFRLAQHPGRNVRRFALDLVEKHLKEGFVPLARLELFFRAALMDLSPERAMKKRVLQLLATRGVRDEGQAEMAASILKDFIRTAVKNDFELASMALVQIKLAHPGVETGLTVVQ